MNNHSQNHKIGKMKLNVTIFFTLMFSINLLSYIFSIFPFFILSITAVSSIVYVLFAFNKIKLILQKG